MLHTTVAIGKNFLGTNVEQLLNLKNPSQGSPQKLRENHVFFLHTLNWQYFPTEKLWICLNLQKMQRLDPQPETLYVEDQVWKPCVGKMKVQPPAQALYQALATSAASSENISSLDSLTNPLTISNCNADGKRQHLPVPSTHFHPCAPNLPSSWHKYL